MSTQKEIINLFGGTALIIKKISQELFHPPFPHRLILDQIYFIGVQSLPLVLITATSTGMVMALQFGLGLEKFGGKLYIPKIVSLSIVREMGPVFTCLILAARVGAGIASELGSMTVTQQIDAIRALGSSPIKKIVIPRVLACFIAIPLLVAIANVVGILGGLIVGVQELGLDAHFYLQKVFYTVVLADFFAGICKTPFFALTIALVSSYYGLSVRGGTQGVGEATTKAVVSSSILIVIGDYFLTKFFWIIEKWL
ncbi:MAG: ABC transporter permease [Bdellovibrionales bacterium]|nr:ABC transporter permease [Bdellovibrionales bacterium]